MRRWRPGADPDDPDARRLALQKVAFEVAVGINRVTPVVATALVTLALLGVRDRALTLGQVQRVLAPVLEYVAGPRALPRSGDCAAHGGRACAGCSGPWPRSKVVTIYTGGEEPVYAIERGQHLVAAFYRNSAIHHFVDRAIAELVLLSDPADRWEEAVRLRDLLKFEFFFPDRDTYREQLAGRAGAARPGLGDRRRRATSWRGRRLPHRPPGAAVVRRRPAGGGRAARRPRPAHARSSRRSSSTSAAGSGSRCCCRAGCTARSRCRGSCSRAR